MFFLFLATLVVASFCVSSLFSLLLSVILVNLILIQRMRVCQFAMFSLAKAFGLVSFFPVSKLNSFRHVPAPEKHSSGPRLQRHVPPGFEGPPYDRSGWCFVEAPVSVAHHISDQFHHDRHVGPTSRRDWQSGQSSVRTYDVWQPSGVDLIRH